VAEKLAYILLDAVMYTVAIGLIITGVCSIVTIVFWPLYFAIGGRSGWWLLAWIFWVCVLWRGSVFFAETSGTREIGDALDED